MNRTYRFFWRWLFVVTAGLMMFGLTLVVMPGLALQGFSWMIFASSAHLNTYGPGAVAYINLVHAVLGAVMFGWGVTMMFLVLGPLRNVSGRFTDAWKMLGISLLAWFVPDTAYSLLSGFWQNAVLNAGFAIMFAIPLVALKTLARQVPG